MKSKSITEVDLHCHTTASDGILTPRQLIILASHLGLKGIGITDHDTIQGWTEAMKAGMETGIEVIRGIELNTDMNGLEVHVLGYEMQPDSSYLRKHLGILQEARVQRMHEIISKLQDLNIKITVEDVRRFAGGESVGRPHIAQALVELGYVISTREAFDRFIGPGAPAYVPRYKLSPIQGIELIRESGGVPVLAHPGLKGLDEHIPIWVDAGLQGLEISHSDHSSEDEKRYIEIAEKYGLIMTGGSDFHGEVRKPGVQLGKWGTSFDVVTKIRELVRK